MKSPVSLALALLVVFLLVAAAWWWEKPARRTGPIAASGNASDSGLSARERRDLRRQLREQAFDATRERAAVHPVMSRQP